MYDSVDTANLPVPHEDGSFVSARVSRFVELIRDYDHTIDVRWIRPSDRGPNDPAFALVTREPSGKEYVIFYVQDEQAFDEGVLAKLYQIDAAKHGNILSEIDALNKSVREEARRAHYEQMEDAKEVAYSILRSPKHRYKHDGVVYE